MKKILAPLIAFIVLVSPIVSFAAIQMQTSSYYTSGNSFNNTYTNSYTYGGSQCGSNSLTLCSVIQRTIGYLNQILFLMIGLAIVIFVWNVIKYFIRPDAERKEAGKYVMYSVIGFFVILSMWGLVNILQNTFGLGNAGYAPYSWSQVSNIFPR